MEFDQEQYMTRKACCRPEVGRGCSFCETAEGITAEAAEGCFKLHEEDCLFHFNASTFKIFQEC